MNVEATLESGEPTDNTYGGVRTLWWRYTATASGQLFLTTEDSNFNILPTVYTGSAVNALTQVPVNYEQSPAFTRALRFNAVAGTIYRIQIRGVSNNLAPTGNIVFRIYGPSPANDHFQNRVTITGFRTVTGTNVGASFQMDEPTVKGNSVWWQFTPTANGPLRINTFGSSFDTVLQVSYGTAVNGLTVVGTNDDAGGGRQSELVFNANGHTTYNISVRGSVDVLQGNIALTVGPGNTGTANIVSAVTPVARATRVGTLVTAFATILNAGTSLATGCGPLLPTLAGNPATLTYRSLSSTGALGTMNGPMNIPAGGRQDFLMSLRPRTAATTNIPLIFDCTNTNPAPSHAGLNTFLLAGVSLGAPAPADMIATTATVAGGGIMNVPLNGTGFVSIAAKNIGAAANMQMQLSASAIGAPAATLPVTLAVCRTNPTTGACLSPPAAPPVNFSAAAGATVTFSAFVKSNGTAIPFDPAKKRLFMNFYQGTTAVGSTSVAVRTVAAGGGVALVKSQ